MIETQQSSISYTADGVQTQWEFPYSYFSVDDIKLFITQDGTRTQIASSDYTFDVTTKKATYPLTGDPVAAGSTVELTRQTDITQLEDSSIQNFKSNDVERIADKLTLISQDLKQEMEDIVAPEGGAIAETVAAAVQAGISAHNASSNSHTSHLVAKTGSTMTGDLTMAKNGTTVSGVRFLDENDTGYRIFSARDVSDNKQLRMFDASAGNGVFLNGGDSNKPYYWDGISTSSRLLDTSDKTTLETSIAGKADKDLSNLTSGLSNTICITAATTTSTASSATPAVVVENYVNGTSWYRVYSDGWCEQGGYQASGQLITFLKPFADSNYSLTAVPDGGTNIGSATTLNSYNKTSSGVYFTTASNSYAVWWRAEGYLASGD
jgi:hypothetical protein